MNIEHDDIRIEVYDAIQNLKAAFAKMYDAEMYREEFDLCGYVSQQMADERFKLAMSKGEKLKVTQ